MRNIFIKMSLKNCSHAPNILSNHTVKESSDMSIRIYIWVVFVINKP